MPPALRGRRQGASPPPRKTPLPDSQAARARLPARTSERRDTATTYDARTGNIAGRTRAEPVPHPLPTRRPSHRCLGLRERQVRAHLHGGSALPFLERAQRDLGPALSAAESSPSLLWRWNLAEGVQGARITFPPRSDQAQRMASGS